MFIWCQLSVIDLFLDYFVKMLQGETSAGSFTNYLIVLVSRNLLFNTFSLTG